MKNSEKQMKNLLVKLIAEISYDICKICGKAKRMAMYKFRHTQYVRDYSPSILEPVCRHCVYKEIYGSKNWKKKMKEGVLDEK